MRWLYTLFIKNFKVELDRKEAIELHQTLEKMLYPEGRDEIKKN